MYTDGEQMYTTDGHIIIALTTGHGAPCLHPTPSPDNRHRATERATGDAEQTGKADTHGQRESHTGRQAQPERGQDRRQSRRGCAGRSSAGTLGRSDRPRQAEPPADRQSHAEPPGCRRGYSYHRRRRTGAERHREPQTGLFVRGIDISYSTHI